MSYCFLLRDLNPVKLNNRLFGQWSFRTLNLAVSRMQEFTTNEPIDVVVSSQNAFSLIHHLTLQCSCVQVSADRGVN